MLIPLMPPDYFLTISVLEKIFTVISVLLFIVLFFLTIIKKEINVFIVLSLAFIFWRIISSYYFSNSITDLSNSVKICTLILLINLTIKKSPKELFNALSIVFGMYIIINFLTLFLFPEGLYVDNPRLGQLRPAWFLGIDNQFSVFLIPGIILAVLSSWYTHSKISVFAWIQIVVATFTIFITFSATAVISFVFVLLAITLSLRKKIKLINISFYRISLIYIVVWFLLVWLNSLELFQTLIVDILEKDMTLSGRTRIWAVVFDVIDESLLYGHGINVRVLVGHTYFVAHNMILQIILESGIIGLSLFVLCIALAGNEMQTYKKNSITLILVIGIFGVLIGGLTEAYRLNYLYMLITIAYNIRYIKDYKNKGQ